MTRLHQSGWEPGGTDLARTEFVSWGSVVSADTARVRTGTYAGKAASGAARAYHLPEFVATLELYLRVYLSVSGNPSVRRVIISCNSSSGSPLRLWLETDRTITADDTVTTFGTTTSTVPTGSTSWVRLECYCKAGDGNAIVTVRMDGTQEFSATNGAFGGVGFTGVDLGTQAGDLGADLWIDDWALNNGEGTINNTWLGAGGIIQLVPSADTATVQWSTVGAPPSHADALADTAGTDTTKYIQSTSKTANLEDRWDMGNTPSALASGDTVNALQFGVRGGGDGGTTRPTILRLRDASNNTVDSASIDWNLNGWKAVYPAITRERTWEGTPVALTKAYLDGIQAAALDTDTSTRTINWTAVWASVDFTPAAPAPFAPRSAIFSTAVTRAASY